jgi:hypothetical protein
MAIGKQKRQFAACLSHCQGGKRKAPKFASVLGKKGEKI